MPIFDYYHVPYQNKKAKKEAEQSNNKDRRTRSPVTEKLFESCLGRKVSPVENGDVLTTGHFKPKRQPLSRRKSIPDRAKQPQHPPEDREDRLQLFSQQLSPYARLLQRLHGDERLLLELQQHRRVGLYRFYGAIGLGNFSQVKLAVHQLTQERVAIKIINKSQLDIKTDRMLSREIVNMEKVHHPHIIRLYEVVETPKHIHLVMEHAPGGELFHKITNEGRLDEKSACIIMCQLVSAVQHLHRKNIFHRDIKAENVFFGRPNVVKLGDLGFSTLVFTGEQKLNTFCGSPPYAAPELFRDDYYIGGPVDAWALGVLLYFMVEGTMPFRGATVAALKRQIMNGSYPEPTHGVGSSCCLLINSLLNQKPSERLTLAQMKQSEWFSKQQWPPDWPDCSLTLTPTSSVSVSSMSYSDVGDGKMPSKKWIKNSIDVFKDSDAMKNETNRGCAAMLETSTRHRLEQLGIDQNMLETSWQTKGCRCAVTGVYRMMFHRLMKIEAGEVIETGSPVRASSVPRLESLKSIELKARNSPGASPRSISRGTSGGQFSAPLAVSQKLAVRAKHPSSKTTKFRPCTIL